MTVTTPSLVHRTLRPPKGLYHLSFICAPIVKWRVALCLSSTFRVSRTPLDAEGEVQTHNISSLQSTWSLVGAVRQGQLKS